MTGRHFHGRHEEVHACDRAAATRVQAEADRRVTDREVARYFERVRPVADVSAAHASHPITTAAADAPGRSAA